LNDELLLNQKIELAMDQNPYYLVSALARSQREAPAIDFKGAGHSLSQGTLYRNNPPRPQKLVHPLAIGRIVALDLTLREDESVPLVLRNEVRGDVDDYSR
jgi:hypothetical protein